MGWTRYDAHCYKPNGTVDRKAECDKLFTNTNEYANASKGVVKARYSLNVIKSVMVGSTYYAAVRSNTDIQNVDGSREVGTRVFAVVCLTAGNSRWDGYNFGVKGMDESCGPNASKCPNSILDLLDEPCNTWAREWRTRCREFNASKRKRVA